MTSAQPPRLATWLLKAFASPVRNENIHGDLVEQYAEGRSGAWYWWQVLIAIAVDSYRLKTAWSVGLVIGVLWALGNWMGARQPHHMPVLWALGPGSFSVIAMVLYWLFNRLHKLGFDRATLRESCSTVALITAVLVTIYHVGAIYYIHAIYHMVPATGMLRNFFATDFLTTFGLTYALARTCSRIVPAPTRNGPALMGGRT
jgi:hypothetical protein